MTLTFSGWPKAGDKMRFLGSGGYDNEREAALKVLEIGQVLTVESCDVGDWSHSIRFMEVPGNFNGVMFEMTEPTPQDSQTLTADAVAYRWRYKYKALGNTEWMFMAAIPSDMLLDNVEIEPLFRQPQDAILQRLISAIKPFSAVADNAIDWPQDAHALRPGIDYPAHIENAASPVLVKHLREAGEALRAALNQGQG